MPRTVEAWECCLEVTLNNSCETSVCACLADQSMLALSSLFEYIYTKAVVLVGAINETVNLARVL